MNERQAVIEAAYLTGYVPSQDGMANDALFDEAQTYLLLNLTQQK